MRPPPFSKRVTLGSLFSYSTFKVADNFISEKIEKEIIANIDMNRSIIVFTLKGNRISRACLNKVNKILRRNRKTYDDREPNKLQTQIHRL